MTTVHVRFCSREEAENTNTDLCTAVISITDPGSALAAIESHKWFDVLRLQFHDIDLTKMINAGLRADILKRYRPMNETQAAEIRLYVDAAVRGGVQKFLVHCEAGISRSAAIAKWIADHHDGPSLGPVTKQHNRHVYGLLASGGATTK